MPRDNPEPYTPDMIATVIESLQVDCARLMAVQEYMKQSGVETIQISNSLSLRKKALPMLAAFAQSAVNAIRDKRLGGRAEK